MRHLTLTLRELFVLAGRRPRARAPLRIYFSAHAPLVGLTSWSLPWIYVAPLWLTPRTYGYFSEMARCRGMLRTPYGSHRRLRFRNWTLPKAAVSPDYCLALMSRSHSSRHESRFRVGITGRSAIVLAYLLERLVMIYLTLFCMHMLIFRRQLPCFRGIGFASGNTSGPFRLRMCGFNPLEKPSSEDTGGVQPLCGPCVERDLDSLHPSHELHGCENRKQEMLQLPHKKPSGSLS